MAAATERAERFVGLALLQPRPAHEARRGRPHPRDDGRGLRQRLRLRREGGQGRRARQGHAGLRREPPARAVPARRDPCVREGRRDGRGHRRRHEARLRPPDGAARAARLRRPRHDAVHRRHHVPRVQGHPLLRRRPCCVAWSRRAATVARAVVASTTTASRTERHELRVPAL